MTHDTKKKSMVTSSFNYFYQVSGGYAVLLDNNNLLSEVVVLKVKDFSNYCSLLLSQLASTQIYLVDVSKITVLLLSCLKNTEAAICTQTRFCLFSLVLFCFCPIIFSFLRN